MTPRTITALTFAAIVSIGFITNRADAEPKPWFGVHLLQPAHEDMPLLKRAITEQLGPMGVNALVLEVNYHFVYKSHPDLGTPSGLTHDDARELSALCRKNGIRLIPQFNCLGHQSWARNTFPLLMKHPEFDETPETPQTNPGIYCRSWCPLHPDVNKVVFALMDELIDGFEADAFHVGMDEVFIIASPQCPRCRGKDPAELFAKAVNDYHKHLVDEKKLTMLMWGDRLLDDKVMHYGKWESSENGTAPAVDRIPRDIVQCDWHYEKRESYPSVPFFLEKGFRVWPASWKDEAAALQFSRYARRLGNERMVGHLCTTWAGGSVVVRELLGSHVESKAASNAKQAVEALKACAKELSSRPSR